MYIARRAKITIEKHWYFLPSIYQNEVVRMYDVRPGPLILPVSNTLCNAWLPDPVATVRRPPDVPMPCRPLNIPRPSKAMLSRLVMSVGILNASSEAPILNTPPRSSAFVSMKTNQRRN